MAASDPPSPELLELLHYLEGEANYIRTYPATTSEAATLLWFFIKRRRGISTEWPLPQIVATVGISTARVDDVAGVTSIQPDALAALTGAIQLVSGSGIVLSEAGQNITIAASGGGADIWTQPVIPWLAQTAVQGTWVWAPDSLANGDGFFWNSSVTQNDEITWPVYLAAGTWTLRALHIKNSNVGVATFALDATTVGTVDGYNAGVSYNQVGSIAGIAVAASAKYTMHMKIATKNASSSGFRWNTQAFFWERTA